MDIARAASGVVLAALLAACAQAPSTTPTPTSAVPPGSTARTMADIDQPGRRIAAVRGAAPLMILERTLKYAKVVAAENENAAFGLMKIGQADGYAQNRFMLRARARSPICSAARS